MFEAYDMSHQQKHPGEAMTDQSVKTVADRPSHRGSSRYSLRYSLRYSWLAEAFQDALMVSSFGFWALLLGFVPVVAFCMLRGS
jgi:hypothetical protein